MVVIDSSILIKAFFREEGSEKAEHLVKNEPCCAPGLIVYEFANYLARHKGLMKIHINHYWECFQEMQIELFALPLKILIQMVLLAKEYNLSSYDASFVTLAKKLNISFITADIKLFNKVKSLGFVRAL